MRVYIESRGETLSEYEVDKVLGLDICLRLWSRGHEEVLKGCSYRSVQLYSEDDEFGSGPGRVVYESRVHQIPVAVQTRDEYGEGLMARLLEDYNSEEAITRWQVLENGGGLGLVRGRAMFRDQQPSSKGSVCRSKAQCVSLVKWASFIVPPKVRRESLGDELERIDLRAKSGMHPWLNELHTLMTVFWALFYTMREIAAPSAVFALIWKFLK